MCGSVSAIWCCTRVHLVPVWWCSHMCGGVYMSVVAFMPTQYICVSAGEAVYTRVMVCMCVCDDVYTVVTVFMLVCGGVHIHVWWCAYTCVVVCMRRCVHVCVTACMHVWLVACDCQEAHAHPCDGLHTGPAVSTRAHLLPPPLQFCPHTLSPETPKQGTGVSAHLLLLLNSSVFPGCGPLVPALAPRPSALSVPPPLLP